MTGTKVRSGAMALRFMRSAGVLALVAFLVPAGVTAEETQTGEQYFGRVCSDCHKKGATSSLSKGAPKLGDRRAWESRVKKGLDTLYNKVTKAKLHGKEDDAVWQKTNPFIWREELTDAQIREALKYMLEMAD